MTPEEVLASISHEQGACSHGYNRQRDAEIQSFITRLNFTLLSSCGPRIRTKSLKLWRSAAINGPCDCKAYLPSVPEPRR